MSKHDNKCGTPDFDGFPSFDDFLRDRECAPGPCPPPPMGDCRPGSPPPPPPGPPPRHCHHHEPHGPQSPWDVVKALEWKQGLMIEYYKQAMDRVNGTLAQVQRTAVDNSAYYDQHSVWTEEGYFEDNAQSARYFVTHIKPADSCGRPIRMQLHLAYDDATNSGNTVDAFHASEMELADKMVSAIPVRTGGWFGIPFWRGAPIPSDISQTNLYTVGFTKKGTMRWFPNTSTRDTLKNAGIQNAMGVYGILVNQGALTDPALRLSIPSATLPKARVAMAQKDDGEVIILTVEATEQHPGLLSEKVANILVGYGAMLAVELCSGEEAITLDKGGLVNMPENNKVPELFAYWFISRKCDIKNKVSFDLAWLCQKYGQLSFKVALHEGRLNDVDGQLEDILARLEVHDAQIADLMERMAQAEADIDKLNNDVQDLRTDLTALEAKVDQEILDRIAADAVLQAQIDAHEVRLDAIDAEIANHLARIEILEQKALDAEADRNAIRAQVQEHGRLIALLRADVEIIKTQITDLQAQLAAQNARIVDILATITQIELALDDLKARWDALDERITLLEQCCTETRADIVNLQNDVTNLDNRVTTNEADISDIKIAITDIDGRVSIVEGDVLNLDNRVTVIESVVKAPEVFRYPMTNIYLNTSAATGEDITGIVDCELRRVDNLVTARICVKSVYASGPSNTINVATGGISGSRNIPANYQPLFCTGPNGGDGSAVPYPGVFSTMQGVSNWKGPDRYPFVLQVYISQDSLSISLQPRGPVAVDQDTPSNIVDCGYVEVTWGAYYTATMNPAEAEFIERHDLT